MRDAHHGPGVSYRPALDRTHNLLRRRAAYYRAMVVTVATVGIGTVATAAAARSFAVLGLLLLLVPVVAGFLVADAFLLHSWRSDLLRAWVARGLDMAAFRTAVRATPALPRETTEAMLATLPSCGDLACEQAIAQPVRRAVAAELEMRHRVRMDSLLLQAAASGVGVAAVLGWLWTGEWKALLILGILGVLPAALAWSRRHRGGTLGEELDNCGIDPDYDAALHAQLTGGPGVRAS